MNFNKLRKRDSFIFNISILLTISISLTVSFAFYFCLFLLNNITTLNSDFLLTISKIFSIILFPLSLLLINTLVYDKIIKLDKYKLTDEDFKCIVNKENIDRQLLDKYLKTQTLKNIMSKKSNNINNIHEDLKNYKINNDSTLKIIHTTYNVLELIEVNEIIKFMKEHNKRLTKIFDTIS